MASRSSGPAKPTSMPALKSYLIVMLRYRVLGIFKISLFCLKVGRKLLLECVSVKDKNVEVLDNYDSVKKKIISLSQRVHYQLGNKKKKTLSLSLNSTLKFLA